MMISAERRELITAALRVHVEGLPRGSFKTDALALVAEFEAGWRFRQLLEHVVYGPTQGACLTCGSEPGANAASCDGCAWILEVLEALADAGQNAKDATPPASNGEGT
jgi:hypothetical protein